MVKVGDTIHSSWGATMRFHDFYKVLKVTPKMVTVQMLKKQTVGGDGWRPIVVPTDEFEGPGLSWSGPLNRKVKHPNPKHYYGIKNPVLTPYIAITSCQFADLEPYDTSREYQEDHLD